MKTLKDSFPHDKLIKIFHYVKLVRNHWETVLVYRQIYDITTQYLVVDMLFCNKIQNHMQHQTQCSLCFACLLGEQNTPQSARLYLKRAPGKLHSQDIWGQFETSQRRTHSNRFKFNYLQLRAGTRNLTQKATISHILKAILFRTKSFN